MKSVVTRAFCAIAVALFAASAAVASTIKASTGEVVQGEWNGNFNAAKAFAEQHKVPMVYFWGSAGCGQCKSLQSQCTKQADWKEWQASRKYVMLFLEDAKGEPKEFVKNPTKHLPYLCFYWPKPDGTTVKVNFSGRSGEMPYTGGGLVYQQVMKSVDQLAKVGQAGGWDSHVVVKYAGGEFDISDSAVATLEVVAGRSSSVEIPLVRMANTGVAAVNKLELSGAVTGTQTVNWLAGEKAKTPVVQIPAASAVAGKTVTVRLRADDNTDHGARTIRVVAEPPVSMANPMFTGAEVGKWTMDLDAALDLTANGPSNACTLVYFTGALWCPHCIGFEKGVFETAEFAEWTVSNNVALVMLENLKRSSNDNNAEPYAVSTVANGAAPSLLSTKVGTYGTGGKYSASGAAYMSRNGITAATAAKTLQRNHDLGYFGGRFCAPESVRTGYPTLILLDKAGNVRGRLARREDDSAKVEDYYYETPKAENMKRLEAFLELLTEGDETAKFVSTTTLSHEIGGSEKATLRVSQNKRFYKVSLPAGRVKFTRTDDGTDDLTFTLMRRESVSVAKKDGAGKAAGTGSMLVGRKVASGKNALSCDIGQEGDYYIGISLFDNSKHEEYGDVSNAEVGFTSSLVLVPAEGMSGFVPSSDTVKMALASGDNYKLSGFGDVSAFFDYDSESDVYTAKVDGDVDLPCTAGEEVGFRLWHPGTVKFAVTGGTVSKLVGFADFKVVRTGGTSGPASFNVVRYEAGSDADAARYSLPSAAISWADGESGEKTFRVTMDKNVPYTPNQTLALELSVVDGAAVFSGNRLYLSLTDTDKPVTAGTTIAQTLFTTFAANFDGGSQKVFNVQGDKVVVKKVSGDLPKGVKLQYDKASGALVLSGAPKAAGSGTYVFTMTDSRGVAGPEITLSFKVLNPASKNKFMGNALSATVPLFVAEAGGRLLVGTVELSQTRTNKLTAKYLCAKNKKKVTFSGQWAGMDADTGTARFAQEKKGATFSVTLGADGALSATMSDPESYASALKSGDLKMSLAGAYDFGGYYTVALPQKNLTGPIQPSSGTGWMTIALNTATAKKTGKAKCTIGFPDGKTAKANVSLMRIDNDFALLPVLVSAGKNTLAAPVKLRVKAASAPSRRAVISDDSMIVRWTSAQTGSRDCTAYGSYYPEGISLVGCCGDTPLYSFFDGEYAAAGSFGALSSAAGDGAEFDVGKDTMKPVASPDGLKFDLKYKAGTFSGSSKLAFSGGKTVKAKFSGVLTPDWYDCGCTDDDDTLIPLVNRPLGAGTCFFGDRINGAAAVRGIAVRLDGAQN